MGNDLGKDPKHMGGSPFVGLKLHGRLGSARRSSPGADVVKRQHGGWHPKSSNGPKVYTKKEQEWIHCPKVK